MRIKCKNQNENVIKKLNYHNCTLINKPNLNCIVCTLLTKKPLIDCLKI